MGKKSLWCLHTHSRILLSFFGMAVLSSIIAGGAWAYSNFMAASLVIGQPNFTSTSSTVSQSSVNADDMLVVNGKFIVADQQNNRVLIWNSIPTQNGAAASIVLGQPDFTSTTANNGGIGAATLNRPSALASDGQRLLVADRNNNRILVWNSIPTSNFTPADVVIGQQNFTSLAANQGGSPGANTLRLPDGLNYQGQLYVSDTVNNRVLIFSSIPTGNNASANLVLGQPDFSTVTSNTGGISASSMSGPHGIISDGRRLVVVEENNNRALIWNSIPTTTRQAADVVVGQADFSGGSANQGGSVTANGLNVPAGQPSIANDRLIIGDGLNNRVLIWNSIPTSNNASADLVLGQSNFTSSTENNGGIGAQSLNFPTSTFVYGSQLFVIDVVNFRILVYENVVDQPGLALNNTAQAQPNNQLKLQGTAYADSPYTIDSVQYSVNGGGFTNATAADGNFEEAQEDFFFIFDPTANQPRDGFGVLIDGYTVQVKATNSNGDVTDRVFTFAPFNQLEPNDNSVVQNAYPSFSFAVNRQRTALRDNLDSYRILVRPRTENAQWTTLIDGIPVDFQSVKGNLENLQAAIWGNVSTNNGVYENKSFYAVYSNDSSTVQVYSKLNPLAGAYDWKVVAVDKAGHTQETNTRTIYSNGRSLSSMFPLAVLNITGIGNPFLNSFSPQSARAAYTTRSTNPVFYGIAWSGSTVTIEVTDQACIASPCTQSFTTIANPESRFGINLPKNALRSGRRYTVVVSVQLGSQFNQLPPFTLIIGT